MLSESVAGGGAFTEEATQTPLFGCEGDKDWKWNTVRGKGGSQRRITKTNERGIVGEMDSHFAQSLILGRKGVRSLVRLLQDDGQNGQADVSELTKTFMQHQVGLRLIS